MPRDRNQNGLSVLGRTPLRALGFALLSAVLWLVACKPESASPEQGELVVAVQTDMSVPDDLDRVRLQVRIAGELRHDETFVIAPLGSDLLPITLTLVSAEQPGTKVDVDVIGFLADEPRVLAHATTTLPKDRQALLRMPLQWLCDGSAKSLSADSFASTCPEQGDACVAGTCVSSKRPLAELPDFSARDLYGGGKTPKAKDASCFDTEYCFEASSAVVVDSDCVATVQVTDELLPSLGMLMPEETSGICGVGGCYVPLDQSPEFGWYVLDDAAESDAGFVRAQLPSAVCSELAAGNIAEVRASRLCEAKTPRTPTCGLWSAVDRRIKVSVHPQQPEELSDAAAPVDASVDAAVDASVVGDSGGGGGSIVVGVAPGGALESGEVIQLTLPGYSPEDAEWSTNNPDVAIVDEHGQVTAVGPGVVTITAEVDGVLTTFELHVAGDAGVAEETSEEPKPITVVLIRNDLMSLHVTPSDNEMPVGAAVQLVALGSYADGTSEDLSAQVSWSSADPSIVSVDEHGLVTALKPGATVVVASGNGLEGAAAFVVNDTDLVLLSIEPSDTTLPAGLSTSLQAMASFSDGSTLDVTASAEWSSSDEGVARVASPGLIAAVSDGETTLFATYNGVTAEATVRVSDALLAALSVTPSATLISAGVTTQLRADASFTDGTTFEVTSGATWSSDDPQIAEVDATGAVIGIAPGDTFIYAAFDDFEAVAQITVTDATPVGLTVVPDDAEVPVGGSVQFSAHASFSDGTTREVTTDAQWSSSDVELVSIDARGVATGNAQGVTTLTATFGELGVSARLSVTDAVLVGLALTPENTTTAAGRTVSFVAEGSFSDGVTRVVTDRVKWASSDLEVASVDALGAARGLAPGNATILGELEGFSASAELIVTDAELTSIVVSPAEGTLPVGKSQQLSAEATFSDGTSSDVTNEAVWTSSAVGVLAVSSTGMVTAIATGSASAQASLDGFSASAAFTINDAELTGLQLVPPAASVAAGQTVQFTAEGAFSDGTTRDVSSEVSWTSGDVTVLTVSASGLARGVRLGGADVRAQLSGFNATAAVTVSAAQLVSIALNPTSATLVAGRSQAFSAQGTFSDGTTANVSANATWRSDDSRIATVSSAGVALGRAVGATQVRARVGEIEGAARVTVTDAIVTRISVTPANNQVVAGRSVQLTATAEMSDGTNADVTSAASWTSAASTIVTVAAGGRATARAAGTTSVTATVGTVSGSAQFIVGSAVVDSLTVTPANPSVAAGNTVQLTATATFSDGVVQNVTTQAVWTSGTNNVATVNAQGVARGSAVGSTQLTATLGGVNGRVTITVTAAVPISLSVTPASASIAVAGTQQLTARATYSDSSTRDVTSTATWASSAATIATVSTGGLVTGVRAGSSNVSAALSGLSATSAITVTAPTVLRLSVTPATGVVVVQSIVTYVATAVFSDGSQSDVTAQAEWQSGNTQRATSLGAGRFQGVAPGSTTATATFGGVSDVAKLQVNAPRTLASLAISPTNTTIARGSTQQFTATATYSDQTSEDVTQTATWSVESPNVASLDGPGLVSGRSESKTNITCTFMTGSANADITVKGLNITSLSIRPSEATVLVGQSVTLRAIGTTPAGFDIDVSSEATWVSGLRVLVVSGGVVTARGTGDGQVGATINKLQAVAHVVATQR